CLLHHISTPMTYTLSLHDALPIFWDTNSGTGTLYFWTNVNPWDDNLGDYTGNNWATFSKVGGVGTAGEGDSAENDASDKTPTGRSEEHTSELQSRENLVCRLLLEK